MKEIFERAKAMIVKPLETWGIVKGETISVRDLLVNYAAPLALIPALATLIGLAIIGIRVPTGFVIRIPFIEALIAGTVGYFLNLGTLLAGAWVVSYLAAYFNSKSDFELSFKLVVYAMTPVWLVGIVAILPGIGILQLFGLYGLYLLYKGLPVLLETPEDKVFWYFLAILISSLILTFLFSFIIGGAVYGPIMMRMMSF
ncbi:MAG: YIP1 family protein [Candidatus Margulisiibacteriota bacterium]